MSRWPERRERRWGRRKTDWAWRVATAASLALAAEMGTGLGRWLWGRFWAWLAPLTGL